ncbi:MAG TPA: TIGR03435 family protein [Bryobacteraceae bacterium]|nr:TIGR03435 family protein [Bryobacteraceae bacterium]
MKWFTGAALIALVCGGSALRADIAFETASVKATPANMQPRDPMQVDSGRVTLNAMSLKILIQMAYEVPEWKIDGANGWIENNRYDISAKFPEGANQKQLPEMLRGLLSERFALQTEEKSKSMKVYALVPAKSGAKLKPSTEATTWTNGVMNGGIGKGRLVMRDMTMAALAEVLSTRIGKPVIDQTDIGGKFAIDLKWSPTEMDAAIAPTDGPSIFTALEEQLGLALRTTTAPVEVISIRHASQPSGN